MARITLNASAPDGAGTFGFGPEELDVTDGAVDTDNAGLIADAARHPWLDVDHGVEAVPEPAFAGTPEPAFAGTPESNGSFDDFGYGEDN